MQVAFFDEDPFRSMAPDLRSLLAGARRLEAAVAFVTKPGVRLFRELLGRKPSGGARLVASVRFPTDLSALAALAVDFPDTVFIHTGYRKPLEEHADRGQFHSKVLLIERDATERVVVIGSHNWTENALSG